MKKLVGILIVLVIVLSGSLIYVLLNDSKEVTNNNPEGNDSYRFQDIEKMEKAASIEEAFNRIFGEERLYGEGIIYNGSQILTDIEMEPGLDTRMEMIDFLHYVQFSELTKRNSVENLELEVLTMRVYQPTKPGMNKPEPHQTWFLFTETVEAMDFSDKETMLGEIHSYGKFKGVNPSGMN